MRFLGVRVDKIEQLEKKKSKKQIIRAFILKQKKRFNMGCRSIKVFDKLKLPYKNCENRAPYFIKIF